MMVMMPVTVTHGNWPFGPPIAKPPSHVDAGQRPSTKAPPSHVDADKRPSTKASSR